MAVEEILANSADWPASQTSADRKMLLPQERDRLTPTVVETQEHLWNRAATRMLAFRITAIALALLVGQLSGCGGDEGTTGPTVVTSVEVTPAEDTLTALGDICRFTAVAKASNGATIEGQRFTWTSSAAGVASVEAATGVVRAKGNWTATITATTEGGSGSASVTVSQLPATVEVWPAAATLMGPGDSIMLFAGAYDANGNLIPGKSFDWSSSDPNVATVVGGLAVFVGPGEATITAATSGLTGNAVLTVKVFASVSAGYSYTCAVTTDGVAYCWGWNYSGELGNGTTGTNRPSPVAVSGGLSFASVSAGHHHTCGVTTGSVGYCWGSGQLGDGTTTPRPTPVEVSGGLSFASVSARGGHICGATTGGVAYCWGSNLLGQLGDGTLTDRNTPVEVSGGLSFSSLSTGVFHTCGVTTDGVAYCWGYNDVGQLGDGTETDRNTPVAVSGGLSFASLSAGYWHTCGVTTGGVAYCWGLNSQGRLGDGMASDIRQLVPVAVSGGLSFASVSAGSRHTCGVTTDGVAYCWGYNHLGRLGDGTGTERHTPVAVSGGLSFASVSAGNWHTCGVTTDGVAYCWGDGISGQLGDGTTREYGSPVPVRVGW